MFNLNQHQYDYFYNLATVVENLIPEDICDTLAERVNSLIANGEIHHVKHSGLGNEAVSDLGGEYHHHIFQGQDIKNIFLNWSQFTMLSFH